MNEPPVAPGTVSVDVSQLATSRARIHIYGLTGGARRAQGPGPCSLITRRAVPTSIRPLALKTHHPDGIDEIVHRVWEKPNPNRLSIVQFDRYNRVYSTLK